MVFVGLDWAQGHHDVCLMDNEGTVLATRRIADSLDGANTLQVLIAEHAPEATQVAIGVETEHGLVVRSLIAAGYDVYSVNPLAVSHYRTRHGVSRAKSDAADAKLLANLVRTDRHNHRTVPHNSALAESVKVLARMHKSLVWTRQQHVNQLRTTLREFYPGALTAFGTALTHREALAVLRAAWTPARGRSLTKADVMDLLRQTGRQRYTSHKADQILVALQQPQLELPAALANAYGANVQALIGILTELTSQITTLESELASQFETHPDAEILKSLPGLGTVLGARVLAEFGDDPTRYSDSRARKNYGGCSPVTVASGNRVLVHARMTRNHRLADAGFLWAFSVLKHSPAPTATTWCIALEVTVTLKRFAPWQTGSSASCMAACATTSPTPRPSPGRSSAHHQVRA